jgi:hypothetical protein
MPQGSSSNSSRAPLFLLALLPPLQLQLRPQQLVAVGPQGA